MTSTTEALTQPLILFLHVPKTGGTTLREIIGRQYPSDAVCTLRPPPLTLAALRERSQSVPPSAAVIEGHMPFGLHEMLPRRSTYITLVRKPIERVISNYYSVLRHPANPRQERFPPGGITLKEYASSGRIATADNRQTRVLSGQDPSTEPCTTTMLEQAKRNLREHFSVVGLTERFDETLLLLKRTFGWRFMLYSKRNVGRDRPPQASVDSDTLRTIEDANRLDLELYDYAGRLFHERLGGETPDFEMELEAFRRVNRQFTGRSPMLQV